MMKMNIIPVALLIGMSITAEAVTTPESNTTEVVAVSGASDVNVAMNDSIRRALDYQRKNYPASQYRDVYKNFMQDFFGPGHILASTAGAEAYLKREMAETTDFDGPKYEPTGFRGNFYRVNIGLVKDGTIPYDVFFDAFVKSVSGITPPTPEYWMGVWSRVDSVIGDMGWKFDNEQTDREAMAKQFAEGNYIVHHSEAYNKAVNFHYRIISRQLFEEKILPYLTK